MGDSTGTQELQNFRDVCKRKHKEYVDLLECDNEKHEDFWDLVIITAIDEDQKKFYESELVHKLSLHELPRCTKYHVFSDPPGARIGCGGSTLHVLSQLSSLYPNALSSYKILLIHAGGYSKRLPHHSASGKIFAYVPWRLEPHGMAITMLEMKFMLFIDFPKRGMAPGIFISCSDDIEIFESTNVSTLFSEDFVAMAHPAPISIGLTHGVFVFDDLTNVQPNQLKSCAKFLHKPSADLMKSSGAIIDPTNERVFVDSNFWFDSKVADTLKNWWTKDKNSKVEVEVDAYGDFLRPLGTKADQSYFAKDTSGPTSELYKVREELFSTLHGKHKLNGALFVPSVWMHIGTCDEYIQHFNEGLIELVESDGNNRHIWYWVENTGKEKKNYDNCVMLHTKIGNNVEIGDRSILEFCIIGENMTIGKNSILSHVKTTSTYPIGSPSQGNEQVSWEFPDNIFMQTLPLKDKEITNIYMTFVIGVADDLKTLYEDSSNVKMFEELKVIDILTAIGLTHDDVWGTNKNFGIWNAKIWPVANSRSESMKFTRNFLSLISELKKNKNLEKVKKLDWKNLKRVSWGEAQEMKNMEVFMAERNHQTFYEIMIPHMHRLFESEVFVGSWVDYHLPPMKRLVFGAANEWNEGKEGNERVLGKLLEDVVDGMEKSFRKKYKGLDRMRAEYSMGRVCADVGKVFKSKVKQGKEKESEIIIRKWEKRGRKYIEKGQKVLRNIIVEPCLFHSENLQQKLFVEEKKKSFFTNRKKEEEICLPARIILAGGWSDTPPFTLEKGGQILNFAVKINDKLPIKAVCRIVERKLEEGNESKGRYGLVVRSVDQKREQEIYDVNDLMDYDNHESPLSVHKTVLCLTLFPQIIKFKKNLIESQKLNLSDLISKYFNNNNLSDKNIIIELETDVDIPKGTGLGTSSILILACVRSILNMFYPQNENEKIDKQFKICQKQNEFNYVLAVEQLLTTCGGWQDQVGGGVKGLKFIETSPQISRNGEMSPVEYGIRKIKFDENQREKFNEKLVVIFTGKQRVAKTVLSCVVENWNLRHLDVVDSLQGIRDITSEMDKAFRDLFDESGSWDRLGELLVAVRKLNIKLEPSFTTDYIDKLFVELEGFVTGSHLIGAGSGGYIIGWKKEGVTNADIEQALKLKEEFSSVEMCSFTLH